MNPFYGVDLGRVLKEQGGTIWLGVRRVGWLLWNALLIPSPFAPVMLFYHVAPMLIVYLYITSPGNAAAFEYLAGLVGARWYVFPLVFVVCAMIGYENRTARVNAVLTLPMIGFGLLILAGLLAGTLPATAVALPLLFLFVGGWGCLALNRYYDEMLNVKKVHAALKQQMDTVLDDYLVLQAKYDQLKAKANPTAEGGNGATTG